MMRPIKDSCEDVFQNTDGKISSFKRLYEFRHFHVLQTTEYNGISVSNK